MRKIIQCSFIFILAISFCTACGPSGKIFIKKEAIEGGHEHVANIEVHRRGFWFLWIIPFKLGGESPAQAKMEDEVLKAYPEAVGVYEYKVVDSYFPWFWVSGTKIKAKIVVPSGIN